MCFCLYVLLSAQNAKLLLRISDYLYDGYVIIEKLTEKVAKAKPSNLNIMGLHAVKFMPLSSALLFLLEVFFKYSAK